MQLSRLWCVVCGVFVWSVAWNAQPVAAVEADSRPFKIKMADGRKTTVRLRGNEHFRWLEDEHHYPVVHTATGYEYAIHDPKSAKLVASGHKLGIADPLALALEPRLPIGITEVRRQSPAQPAFAVRADENHELRGVVNVLVVLMRFKEHQNRKLPTAAQIEIIMNRLGGDPILAPSGSYRDFVHAASYRQFDIMSHIVGWVDFPETEAYYANNDSGLSGGRLDEAQNAALNLVEADSNLGLNISEFDRNKDRNIDAVIFLHSGYSAEDTIGENADVLREQRIWSHKNSTPIWTSKEGLSTNNYFTASALYGPDGDRPCRIGVLLHESAHLGALDDHYNRRDSAGVGAWCLTGEHRGFDGTQYYPPPLSAWCKAQLGWVKPTEITESGTIRIRAIEKSPDVFKITRGFPPGEYLLIENRQPIGFQQKLPAGTGGRGGLAIWHVDETKEDNREPGHPGLPNWPENGRHYKLALLQADGEYELELPLNHDGNYGDGDDLFRKGFVDQLGPGGIGHFPNTDAYQDGIILHTGVVISDISESGEEMTFNVTLPASSGSDSVKSSIRSRAVHRATVTPTPAKQSPKSAKP